MLERTEHGGSGSSGSGGSISGSSAPRLRSVPSSRSAVFKDRQLSPLQKRSLMRFLKAAGEALEGEGPLKVRESPLCVLCALCLLCFVL